MKRLLYSTALVSVLAGSANADTICGINTDTVLKWPGYAGKQNVWFDKGEHFFKYSSTYKGKTHTINHFRVNKESCQKNTILITNDTHDKNHISTPFDLNIDASMGLDISNINIDTSNILILLSFEDEDDEFIGTNYT
jgi:hypothetical protein